MSGLPFPQQHLFSFSLLMRPTSAMVRCDLKVVLICIFLIAKDIEHFTEHLFAICVSSFEDCLFSSLVHLLTILIFKFFYFYIILYLKYSWQRFYSIV